MSSKVNNFSHHMLGSEIIVHRTKSTKISAGNLPYDKKVVNMAEIYETKPGVIPAGYEHRPDLISNLFFDTPAYWWLLMLLNNVADPFEGFNVGDSILIPKLI